MQSKSINPIVSWWVTPKLPREDIFARHNFLTQWLIHPIKRRLARRYLQFLKRYSDIKVIGITGSTGKTTTTEILASILKNKGKTVWSAEGVDPVYNIPNTILRANLKTKFLILEMSVEYPDEMDFYLWLAKPDVGIITNIAPTHTQFLKSEKGVANEKGKLIKSLSEKGTAVLNKEDLLSRPLAGLTKAELEFFGQGSQVSASNIRLNKDLSTDFTLNIGSNTESVHINAFGHQFVDNALASAAAAKALGVNFEEVIHGIKSFKRPKHRLNVFKSKNNGIIFDDTYNSNPKAAEESLETFEIVAKGLKKVAVIGDMLELGNLEEEAHRTLGKKAGNMGFASIIGVGEASRFIVEEASLKMGNDNCFLVRDYSEALKIVKPLLNKNSALFVKGSRSIHLDKLVDALS